MKIMETNDTPPDEAVPFPVTGELDLHTFRPRDLPELLPEYFAECRRLGIREARVVHGKGSGALREGTHRLLTKLAAENGATGRPPALVWTWPAPAEAGGWGATLVRLL